MKQRSRIYYSDAQKAQMWDRWQKGDSTHAIDGACETDCRLPGSASQDICLVSGIASPKKTRQPQRNSSAQKPIPDLKKWANNPYILSPLFVSIQWTLRELNWPEWLNLKRHA